MFQILVPACRLSINIIVLYMYMFNYMFIGEFVRDQAITYSCSLLLVHERVGAPFLVRWTSFRRCIFFQGIRL